MVEPEMAFADLNTIINLAEKLIKYVVNYIISNNIKELEFLENYNKKLKINKLKEVSNADFKKIDYNESIKILEKNRSSFVFNDIK